ncbi:protein adenylyltransferase SelO [Candidatus Pelagadaptatus aseana]|uniref:protein adenylyltransferase SelO n=1 Tax=Candidatus Pelagadaptatus aseana TaxID=3120508 RepID=UPI003C6F1FD2
MKFSNSYIELGEAFYQQCSPTPVANPELFLWNAALAEQMAIPQELQKDHAALAQYFSGNQLLAGSQPIATAYAGHQFGNFNPQLGDGRAHLLGELLDQQGKRWDLQLKGSGTSRFSRGGDGRCAIGPAVREFIMSEAMQALGVPTTRCLAVTTTGEAVYREQAKPGAVVTRMASSHLRVGTFQFFASRGDIESLQALCEFAIVRHFDDIDGHASERYIQLLDRVIDKQIQLVVEWMRVGFIHGVMNTDNTSICGETIDFGPCAMMGIYNPATAYSSIDTQGRYAFGNQPAIAQWNMARFAESLLPLIDEQDQASIDQLVALIQNFPERYQTAYWHRMADKFGLLTAETDDRELMTAILEKMASLQLDYTISFNLLSQSLTDEQSRANIATALGPDYDRWRQRLDNQAGTTEAAEQTMRASNPLVIPRNHYIEAVLASCEQSGDAAAALEILDVVRHPYSAVAATAKYQQPPEDNDRGYQTFCGT